MTVKCPCCGAEIDFSQEPYDASAKDDYFICSIEEFECSECFAKLFIDWIMRMSDVEAVPIGCECCHDKTCEREGNKQ